MKDKKVAIIQTNYIPWKGYFDIINSVDEFILYDSLQYTKRDWRNRNFIKTPQGIQWLTIPVEVKGKFYQQIRKTKVSDKDWGKKHWQTLVCNYGRAPYFKKYQKVFAKMYLNNQEEYLSKINYQFIKAINKLLGIRTKLTWAHDYKLVDGKNDRLINLCEQAKATVYLSGPSAKAYLDNELFKKKNIRVAWMNYDGYHRYPQLYPPFIHEVSILDLLFNTGPHAKKYMLSFRKKFNL